MSAVASLCGRTTRRQIDAFERMFEHGCVGSNRRYEESVARDMGDGVVHRLMQQSKPHSLTDVQAGVGVEDLHKPPEPRPVRAWVRYGATEVPVYGFLICWTESAAWVRWSSPRDPHLIHQARVWRSAVQSARDPRQTGTPPRN